MDRDVVADRDELPESVVHLQERSGLLLRLVRIVHPVRRLDVDPLAPLVGDEIYLQLLVLPSSGDVLPDAYHADIYPVAAAPELVVDRVLHQMAVLVLSESQSCIPQSQIDGVVLRGSVDVSVAFEVEPLGSLEEERILEEGDVFRNSVLIDLRSATSELRDDIGREESGIASCYVQVHVPSACESVDEIHEILRQLDLVDHHIVLLGIDDAGCDLLVQGFCIAEMSVLDGIQRYGDSVVAPDAGFQAMVAEDVEEKVRFASASDPGDDLHTAFEAQPFQAFQIDVPPDLHSIIPVVLDISNKF